MKRTYVDKESWEVKVDRYRYCDIINGYFAFGTHVKNLRAVHLVAIDGVVTSKQSKFLIDCRGFVIKSHFTIRCQHSYVARFWPIDPIVSGSSPTSA